MRRLPRFPKLPNLMSRTAFISRRLRFVSIRAKILLLPGIALIGLLAYCLYTITVSQSSSRTLDDFALHTLPVMTLAAQANQGLVETQATFTQALGDKDEFLVEDAMKAAAATRASIVGIKEKDVEYGIRIDEITALWDHYVESSKTAVTGIITGKGGNMAAFQALAADKQKAYDQVHEALTQLNEDSKIAFQYAIDQATTSSLRALKIGIAIVIGLSLLTIFVALLVDAAIRQPIERLNDTIAQVAQGDFSVRVEEQGRDAISTMCAAFNALLADLNAAIAESNKVLAAVGRGDFSQRVTAPLMGDLARLKTGVNSGADSVSRTMGALDAVMDALANGDFSARMSEDVEGESRLKVDKAMSLLQQSLSALASSLSAAAEGDFSRRIDTDLPGDLGTLKRAVNQSLSSLEAAFDEISATTQALKTGDLTRRATGQFAGTLQALTQALNDSLDSLAQTIREVLYNAEELNLGVGEIAQGNADLSARTERQAAALEESSASIEQLLSTAQAAADNSRQTSQLTQSALDNSREGTLVAGKAGQSMVGITEASARIGDIIGLIDSVAFQSNLLALNAAVEAARVGEHGRGFAVVASEMRSLAQRTAASSKEIRDLISTANERVQDGTGLVGQSRRQLEAINQSNETIARLSEQSATSAQEQSLGLEQLSRAVGDLESLNQQNSALVEEVAAASASLRNRAASLHEVASRFNLPAEHVAEIAPKPAHNIARNTGGTRRAAAA